MDRGHQDYGCQDRALQSRPGFRDNPVSPARRKADDSAMWIHRLLFWPQMAHTPERLTRSRWAANGAATPSSLGGGATGIAHAAGNPTKVGSCTSPSASVGSSPPSDGQYTSIRAAIASRLRLRLRFLTMTSRTSTEGSGSTTATRKSHREEFIPEHPLRRTERTGFRPL